MIRHEHPQSTHPDYGPAHALNARPNRARDSLTAHGGMLLVDWRLRDGFRPEVQFALGQILPERSCSCLNHLPGAIPYEFAPSLHGARRPEHKRREVIRNRFSFFIGNILTSPQPIERAMGRRLDPGVHLLFVIPAIEVASLRDTLDRQLLPFPRSLVVLPDQPWSVRAFEVSQELLWYVMLSHDQRSRRNGRLARTLQQATTVPSRGISSAYCCVQHGDDASAPPRPALWLCVLGDVGSGVRRLGGGT